MAQGIIFQFVVDSDCIGCIQSKYIKEIWRRQNSRLVEACCQRAADKLTGLDDSHTCAYALSADLAHINDRHITLQRVVLPGHPQSHTDLFDEWWDYYAVVCEVNSTDCAGPAQLRHCETVFLLLCGGHRWHSTLSIDNWKPVCPSSYVLATVVSRRNSNHRPALLWRFRDSGARYKLHTYLLT